MRILALDLSLNETGFCILDNGKIIDNDIIKVTKNTEQIDRVIEIRDFIAHNILIQSPFDGIFIENYSFGSKGIWTFSCGEMCGAIKLMLKDLGFKYYMIAPTMWKKFVLGKGTLPKDQIMLQCYKQYGVEFTNNNMCDAYCIAKFGESFIKYKRGDKEKLTKIQIECFKKYTKEENPEKDRL